jgi:type IX secretion system PorP/SprF family membrane protein
VKRKLHIVLLVLALLPIVALRAQLVPVYSQYLVNQSVINPAYAGVNNCLNINALYRQQWTGLEGAPSTRTLSAHSPLKKKSIGVGLNVVNDVIAVTSNTLVEGLFSYWLKTGNKSRLSLGLGVGVFINKNSLSNLQVNDAGDEVFVNKVNSTSPTFSFGTYYENRNFFAGFSALNLNRNMANTRTFLYQQPFYFTAGYHHKIDERFTFTPSILLKKINKNPIQLDFNLMCSYQEKIKLALSYRSSEALYAILLFRVNHQFQIGYSYDYSLSVLRKYHNGSHEVSVCYVFQYKTPTVDVKTFD